MSSVTIGVFAVQGAVQEHIDCVTKLGYNAVPLREVIDFQKNTLDGIILPGGESTTMAIVGEKSGIFPILRDWISQKKPVWGTCAGMIILSDHAIKQAKGGQSLVGGLDVHVCRNFFGSQIYSCEIDLTLEPKPNSLNTSSGLVTSSASDNDLNSCKAVFIRAPAILKVGPDVEVLATLYATPHKSAQQEVTNLLLNEIPDAKEIDSTGLNLDKIKVIVAVQQKNILATAFHPELTDDLRWHRYFIEMVKTCKQDELITSSSIDQSRY